MCIEVKYGIWNAAQPQTGAVNALVGCGYAPLTAMVLSARGIRDAREALAAIRAKRAAMQKGA